MSKYKIVWTSIALESLREIIKFIEQENPAAAQREAGRIKRSILRLKAFPGSGKAFLPIPGIREIIVTPYRIFYEIMGKNVVIHRVIHGKRDVSRMIGNKP